MGTNFTFCGQIIKDSVASTCEEFDWLRDSDFMFWADLFALSWVIKKDQFEIMDVFYLAIK